MKRTHAAIAACGLLVSTGLTAQAAVITPTLVTGTNMIDPAGSETLDASGSGATAEATIEAMPEARAVQTWANFATSNSGATGWLNYVSFTDPLLPDIRFTATGLWRNGSTGQQESGANTALRATSGTSNLRMIGDNNNTTAMVFRIDFGDYTPTGAVWDGSVNSVSAAGLTLSNLVSGLNATASFYTDSGTLLSSQSISGADSDATTTGGIDVYFGYKSTSANIGYVLVSKVQAAAGTNKSQVDVGLDDLVFTTVPEPASLGLLAAGALGLVSRPRSRHVHRQKLARRA